MFYRNGWANQAVFSVHRFFMCFRKSGISENFLILKTLDLKFFLQHMHVDRRKCSYLSLTNVDAPFDKLATVVDPTKLTVLATVDILPTPVYHTDDRREADRRAVRLWHLRTASNLGSSPHFRNSQSVKHKDTSIK